MVEKRETYGTSLFPKHQTLAKRLAADLGKNANQVLEEALELYGKSKKDRSDAYEKFLQKK